MTVSLLKMLLYKENNTLRFVVHDKFVIWLNKYNHDMSRTVCSPVALESTLHFKTVLSTEHIAFNDIKTNL